MLPSRDLRPDLAMARPSQERVEVKAGRVPVRLRHQAGPHTIATLFCFLFARQLALVCLDGKLLPRIREDIGLSHSFQHLQLLVCF